MRKNKDADRSAVPRSMTGTMAALCLAVINGHTFNLHFYKIQAMTDMFRSCLVENTEGPGLLLRG